ncbi:MAG: heavy-metal-associated domain-containing protein [Myxococcota bacterium]
MMRMLAGAVLALTLGTETAMAAVVTKDFGVQGWSCGGCANKTVSAVKKLHGVSDARADVDRATLTVTYDDAVIAAGDIAQTVKKLGYSCPVP